MYVNNWDSWLALLDLHIHRVALLLLEICVVPNFQVFDKLEGVANHAEIFLSYSLITMQNFIDATYRVGVCRTPQNAGNAGPDRLELGRG